METILKLEIGGVFQRDDQWYEKISERQARAISAAQAHQIRRDKDRLPRTVPLEESSSTGRSSSDRHLQSTYFPREAPRAAPRQLPQRFPSEAQSPTIYRPRTEAQLADRTRRTAPRERWTEEQAQESKGATSRRERSIYESKSSSLSKQNYATDQRIANRELESPDASPNPPKFNVLAGVICYFVQIPETDYEQRAVFLSECPELLRYDLSKLFLEALYQMMSNQSAVAKQCIGSLAIIRICNNLKKQPDLIEKRVKALSYRESQRFQQYREIFASIEEDLMDTVSKQNSKREQQRQPVRTVEPNPEPSATVSTHEALLDALSENISDICGRSSANLYIPPEQFNDDGMRKLSASYQIQNRAKAFFIPGRVFSVLWHEAPAQRSKSKKATDELLEPSEDYIRTRLVQDSKVGGVGQEISSHVRRFVVIRTRAAYCWCISIGTYGGQGLKKRGLKRRDIHSHTIVYDSKSSPKSLPGEPEISKRPIAVVLRPGQTLSPASRLHYAKPSTIEYNTPVQEIGMVDKKDLMILLSEVANELLPDSKDM